MLCVKLAYSDRVALSQRFFAHSLERYPRTIRETTNSTFEPVQHRAGPCLACTTTFQDTKIDHKSAGKNQAPLKCPSDLTQLSQDLRYTVPWWRGIRGSHAGQCQRCPGTTTNTASNKIGDVRIERATVPSIAGG